MKKIFYVIILIVSSISFEASSQEAKVPCRNLDGSLGLKVLDSFDCKLASKISSDAQIKKEYKDFVDKKIAQQLAKKSSEVIENLALLDSYFDQNDIDLGSDENVKKSCQLEKIAEAACPNNKISKIEKEKKIAFILGSEKHLPKIKNKDNNSLYKRLLAKANDVRSGNKALGNKQCPLGGDSGNYILSSQFNSSDAAEFIQLLKGKTDQKTLQLMYKSFPQLKMLLSPGNHSLKDKFEASMVQFNGASGSEKAFIDNFFKDKVNQKDMAGLVAKNCENLEKDIEKFVCVDNFPHLGMKADDRDVFFDENKDDEVFKEISRGLSCEMENVAHDSSGVSPFDHENSIQKKYEYFSKENRVSLDSDIVDLNLKPFCSLYLCEDPLVKSKMKSCKNGGPISSNDILATCSNQLLKDCDPKIQKYYSYVLSLERDAVNSGLVPMSLASGNQGAQSADEDTPKKARGFSSFYQNLLGVEGTLAAEGKIITPIAIAEKQKEFVERKLDPTPLVTASRSQVNIPEKSLDARAPQPTTTSPAGASAFNPIAFSAGNQGSITAKKLASGSSVASGSSGGENKISADEVRKFQSEIGDLIKGLGGSESEKLAAVANNNQSIVRAVGPTASADAKTEPRAESRAEKERLARYRENLGAWENRLQDWEGDLRKKEVRSFMGPSSNSDVARAENTNRDSGAAASASRSTSSALLSASASASAKNGKAGDKISEATNENLISDDGLIILSSKKLASLEKDSLEAIGIDLKDSFILNVRHLNKTYAIAVHTFKYGEKKILVPLLNDGNRDIAMIINESPLFSDYQKFLKETKKDTKKS